MSTTRTVSVASINTGLLTLVSSYKVSGAAVTTMPVTGLNQAVDGTYLVEFSVTNPGAVAYLSLFYNGDTVATNYDEQSMTSSHIVMTPFRNNSAYLCDLPASGVSGGSLDVSLDAAGKPQAVGNMRVGNTTAIRLFSVAHSWRTAANVTSLNITSDIASTIGIGSYVRVYKIGSSASGSAYTQSIVTATTTSTTIPLDSTIPQSSEGVALSGLDTTISPTASTASLEVTLSIPFCSNTTSASLAFAIFRDAGTDALAATLLTIPAAGQVLPLTLRFVVAAGSTAATTFKVRWGVTGGTGSLLTYAGVNYFGASNLALMTVREIR